MPRPPRLPPGTDRPDRRDRPGRISPLLLLSLIANLALAGGLAYLFYVKPARGPTSDPGAAPAATPRNSLPRASVTRKL